MQALAHFLSYCGPDARETWSHGPVGLGHTMLRTTRASQIERQPASLGGRFWITADARIDCREELKSKLDEAEDKKLPGPPLTDSDLILRAYAAWGADCVQHLAAILPSPSGTRSESCFFARATISASSPSIIPSSESYFSSATRLIACASIRKFPRN